MANFRKSSIVGIFEIINSFKLGDVQYSEVICECGNRSTRRSASLYYRKFCGPTCSLKKTAKMEMAKFGLSGSVYYKRLRNGISLDLPPRPPGKIPALYMGLTAKQWCKKLRISECTFRKRLKEFGPDDPRVFEKKRRKRANRRTSKGRSLQVC